MGVTDSAVVAVLAACSGIDDRQVKDMTKENTLRRGILTKGVGGLYTVLPLEEHEEVLCRARGKFRLDGVTPLPGDVVQILPTAQTTDVEFEEPIEASDDEDTTEVQYVIREIEPRQNTLIRPPMANLTHIFVVLPCAEPAPDLLMADKLTAIAVHSGVRPVMIVNKADIAPDMGQRLTEIYTKAGFPVFLVSAASGMGIDALEDYLTHEAAAGEASGRPMQAAFAGVSAAGKSTLMTRLYPHLSLKTNTVSRKIERGRHTTRHVQLYPVSCGGHTYYLADTPGFSMLDFTRFNLLPLEDLPDAFPEFADCLGNCRYTKCTHTKEEGCAVLDKLHNGNIAPSRHENFVAIWDEIRKKPQWQREKEAEQAEKQPVVQGFRQGGRKTNHRRKR